jgi:hypothetical protein
MNTIQYEVAPETNSPMTSLYMLMHEYDLLSLARRTLLDENDAHH